MSAILMYLRRKTRASMHRLHVGPQELGLVLARHESVGRVCVWLLCAVAPLGPRAMLTASTGSQFLPTRCRRSRRSSPSTRSFRKAIPLLSRRRNQTPAGSRACRGARPLARACEDMRHSFPSTFTISWPSLPSIGNIQNSTVREAAALSKWLPNIEQELSNMKSTSV